MQGLSGGIVGVVLVMAVARYYVWSVMQASITLYFLLFFAPDRLLRNLRWLDVLVSLPPPPPNYVCEMVCAIACHVTSTTKRAASHPSLYY